MDSKVSYAKIQDVECLQEEIEEPQVVTARTVGKIRGFFIMVAALSLTIFIGLVVVVIINDINDRPLHNGYYGHSSEIAQHEGCRFHIMSLEWLRGSCRDEEPLERFRNFGPGDWYTDTDLDEPCDREGPPGEAEGST
jgi:hypothetical protein